MNDIQYKNAFWLAMKTGTDANGAPIWEDITDAMMPFGGANYLDERLDDAYISLKRSETAFFKPTTEIRVEIEQIPGNGTPWIPTYLYFVVASDDAELCPMNYGGSKKFWRHELYLIEITKLLEGIVAEAATYTNTSGTAYSESDWIVA